MKRLLTATTVVVASALLLSACGGGGGGTPPDTPPVDQPDPAIAERQAINSAIMTATTRVHAVNDTSTDADVMAADAAIAAAKKAISDAANVPATEKTAHNGRVTTLETTLTRAKASRMTAMGIARDAMVAKAAKLHAGISAPMGDANSPATTDRAAGYVTTAGTPPDSEVGDFIVSIGDGTNTPVAVILSEDKDTMVAALNGWDGKRFHRTMPASEGTYEAYVYSHVGEPTEGAKFNSGTGNDNVGFDLDSGSTDTVTLTADLNMGTRIASPRFTHGAGSYTPKLPDPNPRGETTIPIAGSYYGVAGTYTCTPATGSCAVNKAAEGYMFAAPAAWTFKATNPEAKVTSMPDNSYASYGWWLHTAADGDLTASAFVDRKGTAEAASGLDTLNGTATYMGSAAGQYALTSTTGGTNDAGHFTARATLNANFTDNEIAGTIDQFMDGDGDSKGWSVALMKSSIAATGGIAGDPDDATDTGAQMTQWTIGTDAADAAGNWTGSLQENGDDGVPEIATGTFYSTYGTAGKMVGAFGANQQ